MTNSCEIFIESQLKPWQIDSPAVLAAFRAIERRLFLPSPYHRTPYADMAVSLTVKAAMRPPAVLAKLLQAAAIEPSDTVLNIGVGSGFSTALLDHMSAEVYALELDPALLAQAQLKWDAHLKHPHIHAIAGDGWLGHPTYDQFDVILCTAAVPKIPTHWLKQLSSEGGRCVFIQAVTPNHAQAIRAIREGEHILSEVLFETDAEPLKIEHLTEEFIF